jgi:hypothetical protein
MVTRLCGVERVSRCSERHVQHANISTPFASYRFRLASIHAANDSANFLKKSRVLSLVSFPSVSKRLAAPPMYASGCCIARNVNGPSEAKK